jgi:hypothetical protein
MRLLDQMRNKDVEHPIFIHVAKSDAHIPLRRTHPIEREPALHGFVLEGAVPSIHP